MTKGNKRKLIIPKLESEIFQEGYQKAQEDVLKIIKPIISLSKELSIYCNTLFRKYDKDFNERGKILKLRDSITNDLWQLSKCADRIERELEELKKQIINSQQDKNTTGVSPNIKQMRETGLADGSPKDTQTHEDEVIFMKFIDEKGHILYKENSFDMSKHKLADFVSLKEKQKEDKK